MALEQLYSLRARFKDCQQIVDENGNVINAFPPQTLFRRPVNGNETFLPVPNTGFDNMIRVMSFRDIGCNGTGPHINCCGKIRLHPEGFFGGLPSALFYPDSQGNPPAPLYLTENYFDVDFNVWQEITGYSILWEYLGQSGVNPPRIVAVGWETGCLQDPGIYRLTIMDACGSILRSSFNIDRTAPAIQFASPFNPQNNQNQVAFYESTINASLQQNENPRVYVTPYVDANNNILPGAIFDTAWASIGCTVDFEVQVDNCCGPTRIKVSTAGTLGSAPSTVIFSQIMQQDPTSQNSMTRYIFKNFDILDFNLIVDITDACGNNLNRTVTIDRSVSVYYRNPRINVLSTNGFNPQNDPRPYDLIYLDNVTFKGAQRSSGLFYGAHARQAPLTREAPFRSIDNQGGISPIRAWLHGASVAPDEVSYQRLFPAFVRVLNVTPVQGFDFLLGAMGTGLNDRAWVVRDPTPTGPVNHATTGLDVNTHLIGPLYGVYRITAPYQCSQARRNPLPGFPNFSGLIARDYAEKFAHYGYRGENDVVTGLIPETQAPTSVTNNWVTRVTKGPANFNDVLIHNQRRIPFALNHATFIAVSQFLYTRPTNTFTSTPGVLPTKLLSSSVYIQYDSSIGQGLQNALVHEISLNVDNNFNTQVPNSSMFSSTDVQITLRETFSTRRVTADIEENLNVALSSRFNLATIPQQVIDYVYTTPVLTGFPNCNPVPPTTAVSRTRFLNAFGNTGQFFNTVNTGVITAFNSNRLDLFRRGVFAKFLDQVVGNGPNQVPLSNQDINTLRTRLFNQNFTLTSVVQTFVSFMVAPHQEVTVNRALLLGTLNFGDSAFDKSNMQVAVSKRPGNNNAFWFDLYVDGAYRNSVSSGPTTVNIPALTVRQRFENLPPSINLTHQQGTPDQCNNIPITIANIDNLFSSVTINSYTVPAASIQLNYGLLDPNVYQNASWIREISYNNPGNFNNRAVSFVTRGSTQYAFNDFSFYGGYTALTDVTNAINLTSGIAGESFSVPTSSLEGLTDNAQTSLPSPFLEDTIWNIWNFGHGAFPANALVSHAPNLGDAFNGFPSRILFFVNATVGRYMTGYFSGLTGSTGNNFGIGSVFYAGSWSTSFTNIAAPTVYLNDSATLMQTNGSFTINPVTNASVSFNNVTLPNSVSFLVNAMRNRKRELFSQTTAPDAGRMYSNAAGPDYAFNYSEDYTPINSYEPYPF
jgi:hypothetical protein